ncbi:bifunctional proline dehydrogenase/L-glutamate gamma-semialdehyde dehydrogenase [bacterium]|nr:bifunctional proline dehydrogenase/L-glutamate gamma-semialdehyde dehydrogenase [bacterium]
MSRDEQLEARVKELGQEIFEKSRASEFGLFNKNYWSGRMMDWSMKNAKFKVELFRFVDVLPTLKTSDQIVEHVKAYFMRPDLELSAWIKTALGAATLGGVASKIASSSIKKNVESMAKTFICGENSQTAEPTLKKLWETGSAFTLDILGEVVVSEKEAQEHYEKYLELIENLPSHVESWGANPQLEEAAHGKIPRVNVSVKCSSLYSQISNLSFESSVEGVKARLRPLMQAARDRGVHLHFDMEQNDIREIVLRSFEDLCKEDGLKNYAHFGIVIQAYLKDSLADLERIKALAQLRGAPITIRLVKGAYWEYEYILAQQRNWEVPVFLGKSATDAHYEKCSRFLVDGYPHLIPAFASHNVRSLAHALAYAESKGLPKNAYEIQLLFGMADTFKKALYSMGYRVREYTPVGDLLPGMAYLVRRLLENTSNEGFLKARFVDEAAAERLLSAPSELQSERAGLGSFVNEAYVDFSKNVVRNSAAEALKKVEAQFPISVFPVVAGVRNEDVSVVEVKNPSKISQCVSRVGLAGEPLALAAVEACSYAKKNWSAWEPSKRIEIIRRAADLIRERRYELSALIVHEVAKDFVEADADVAEAIDFCNYYAKEYERLSGSTSMGSIMGEDNRYQYRARGLAVAISPWNFPLAILCGLTVAPLVCGSPVIMKPAEESSAVALRLFEILVEAGVSKDALQFLPGKGEEIGAKLVRDPNVHVINFTGSRDVGLEIIKNAAEVPKGQKHIKRAVVELGGKNAIIVDDDADLDEAVVACLASAFSFQGQKCSALSRIIILEPAYEYFKARLIDALSSKHYGPAADGAAHINPVVTEQSQQRLLAVLERNKVSLVFSHDVPKEIFSTGHYVPATIFESTDFDSELGQQEFFGPLVTLFKVSSFEEAVQRLNNVDYALTGGLFSRNPLHIDYARKHLEVGNMYLNRGITGALVYRQPFGGFKLSGAGGKAGGPDYLLNFLEPQTVTENTMRRGFSPELT